MHFSSCHERLKQRSHVRASRREFKGRCRAETCKGFRLKHVAESEARQPGKEFQKGACRSAYGLGSLTIEFPLATRLNHVPCRNHTTWRKLVDDHLLGLFLSSPCHTVPWAQRPRPVYRETKGKPPKGGGDANERRHYRIVS